ncbi:MAG TPA: CRISPR-associated endonuclease Cas2 [Candidatus Paceibacterota bacterium]
MGTLETKSRGRLRRGQLETAILGTLAAVGIVAVALTAPNMVKLLKCVDPNWLVKRDPRERLYVIASRLRRKGLVKFECSHGKTRMVLTEKGRSVAQRAVLGNPLPQKARWDRKWRMLIFDIPEKRRPLRDKIRSILTGFGFVRLQNSVWVFPYDCEDIITLLKTELQLGTQMLYIIADAIEYDKPIRAHFGLRQRK